MNDYEKMLNRLTERTKTLLTQLDGLHDIPEDEIRNPKLIQAALSGELLAKTLRKLLIMSGTSDRSTLYHQVCITNGYSVRMEGEITIITMPPLPLKERAYTNYQYFINPLLYCMETYVKENPAIQYDSCLLKIKHIFPADTPLRRLHDFDNLEVKKVIDAVAVFFLTDDNIRKCQVHHLGEVGDDLRTEIWIYPLRDDGDESGVK